MARNTTPKWVPHLAQTEDGEWYVRLKKGLKEYANLPWKTRSKRLAARWLREAREEMATDYLKKLGFHPED